MKTQGLILSALLLTGSLYAQGTSGYVQFQNTRDSLIQVLTPGGLSPAPTDGGYEVEMFYQPNNGGDAPASLDGSLSLGNWQGTQVVTVGIPLPGYFFGPIQHLAGIDGGANAWIEIVGWNNGQTSFADAANSSSLFAFSSVFNIQTGDPNAQPPTVPPLTSGPDKFTGLVLGFQGMVFLVPEPSAIALAGVCAMTLFGFARRCSR